MTDYATEPLSLATWPDLEVLAEANGGVWGGCWCQFGSPGEVPRLHNQRAYENRQTFISPQDRSTIEILMIFVVMSDRSS